MNITSCVFLLAACAWGGDADPPKKSKAAQNQVFLVPGKTYGLSIDLSGFTIEKDNLTDDKSGRYVLATHPKTGITVSFWLLPAETEGSSKVCLEKWWPKESKKWATTAGEKREKGDLAIVDYFYCVRVRMDNVRAYLAHKKTWVDIHISKAVASASDKKKFERIIDSVKIIDPCSGDSGVKCAVNVKNEIAIASRYYLGRDYRNAAVHYQRAFDSEKKSRTLSETTWRVMVDNLGMSYGLTGKPARAKAIFEYGVKEDPKYPMFHYNLACAWAELNSLQNAIIHLKKAYALKDNMMAGEHIPDPRTDASFKKYQTSGEFKKALESIGL